MAADTDSTQGFDLDRNQNENDRSPCSNDEDNIFINGDSESGEAKNHSNSNQEDHLPSQILPRRSSLIKDAASRKHQRKKTVSFSSMPTERKITTAQDCLTYMQNGSDLVKVRSNSRQYHRLFSLNNDMTEIRWHPTSKKPHKARISISCIKEVRLGKTTEALKNKEIAGSYPDECAFSVIFGENFDSMDLIASTPDEANIWVSGLTCLLNATSKLKKSPDGLEDLQQMRDSWLLEMFESADIDNCGVLDEFEVIGLMKKLNSNVTPSRIQQKLKELQLQRTDDRRGRLNSDEFISLFKEISTRPEIYFLLVRYASNADYMTTDDLLFFLEAEQGMQRVTKDRCLEIIEKFEPSKDGRRQGQLGIDGFTAYLLSEECDLFDVDHKTVCQDMSHPLSHYFISSSHNTYLLEDQLKGPSSVEGYIQALQKGCRCVELDCWDGPDDEPIIYHGHTLTSKIPFKSVVEAINDKAFETSEYPVILSIENHCSTKQQQVMAHHIKSIFGERLYCEVVEEDVLMMPSPEQLKGKLLIKGKKLNSDAEEGYVTDEDEGAESDRKKNNKREGSVRKHKLVKELSDLVNYFVSRRFADFQVSQQIQKVWEVCSFSESQALKQAIACPEEFVNHNKYFMSRVYPNGVRVDSSNYNPQDFWNSGCQMVSLNFQTPGLMMDLYDGWFQKNGGCGYVLKPGIMREEIAYFSASTKDVIPGVSPQILHIKVISGQHLPKPRGGGSKGDVTDPYVTIEIFGIPADCAEERTKTVPHNGYNPIFDESFEFQINLPELALVRFSVLDDDFIGDEFIGQYTIPFECMQTGYRHLRLLSNTGDAIEKSTLFVHVAITNKRGGGKGNKRGMVHKRAKKYRDYASMKPVGVRTIDETFKVAIQPLRDGTDLRDKVQVALANFKETCGLAPTANVKQCIRLLATRIANLGEPLSLNMTMKGEYPSLESQGNLPEILRKAFLSFDQLINLCRSLIENADKVYEKLLECQTSGLEWHEELEVCCQQTGLKGKKFSKAIENFAWNIRVLKGQADLLQQAKRDGVEYIRQIQEAGVSTGLVKDLPT